MEEDNKKLIEDYIGKVKTILEPFTAKRLFENSSDLARNPKLREEAEKSINQLLPDGYSFTIDEFGIGRLSMPLYVSTVKDDEIMD